mmetsp:Transcript_18973/g.44939  ORF Transcript_18973/g.44939 Transcript_18973/m.44939 type:complete len:81 (-) Transcript_18973:106-348(-)
MFLNVEPAAQPSVMEPSQANAPTISGGTPSLSKANGGSSSKYPSDALTVDTVEARNPKAKSEVVVNFIVDLIYLLNDWIS